RRDPLLRRQRAKAVRDGADLNTLELRVDRGQRPRRGQSGKRDLREIAPRIDGSAHFVSLLTARRTYVRLQPLRTSGLRYRLASAMLVTFIFALSHSSLPSKRSATTPSRIHSVNGPATLKFEQAGSPPLQARSQSRWCPGDLVRSCGGSVYSFMRASGSRRVLP